MPSTLRACRCRIVSISDGKINGANDMLFNVKQLRYRCEQSIADIIRDASALGDTARVDTPDGPLVWVRRGAPVLGCVHLDFVDVAHKWGYDKKRQRVYTPRLDDRAGVFILLDVLPSLGIHLDLLLTDSEECGRSTAKRFVGWCDSAGGPGRPAGYNWLAQFDRRGKDAVCYDYRYSDAWTAALKGAGFDLGIGSFSDIAALYDLGLCGVNIGVGYHGEHTTHCYGDLGEMVLNLNNFRRFYASSSGVRFPFEASMRPVYTAPAWRGWHEGDEYGYPVRPPVRYWPSRAERRAATAAAAKDDEICQNCGDRTHWRDMGDVFCKECEWYLKLAGDDEESPADEAAQWAEYQKEIDKRELDYGDGFFD